MPRLAEVLVPNPIRSVPLGGVGAGSPLLLQAPILLFPVVGPCFALGLPKAVRILVLVLVKLVWFYNEENRF